MCNCRSYNKQVGQRAERQIDLCHNGEKHTVCVDACIADLIQEINNAGVVTVGSCCGHSGGDRSGYIQIANNPSPAEIATAKEIIKKHGREIPVCAAIIKWF
ncbi:MAG: hypothetical protein VB042_05255 [Victivallaceae bacterium]|nr:hypothetical protein [Victivallaceae bacterium]